MLLMEVMLIKMMMIMMITNDQEALDCLNSDGEAESDQENGVDQRSHNLQTIHCHHIYWSILSQTVKFNIILKIILEKKTSARAQPNVFCFHSFGLMLTLT